MDLFLLLGLILILTGAPRAVDGQVNVTVEEGHEVILPCSVSTNMESDIFVWKNKDGKEVFFYEKNGRTGNESGAQLKDFNDRAFHFKEELKNGNASIRITNTKMADSGEYICFFPKQNIKTCHVELVVACLLMKDRTAEIKGVCPKPYFAPTKINNQYLLQCEVSGVSSHLQLEINDSSGNALPGQPKKESKDGITYDMVLQTKVTKTDNYTCVATEKDICHQISSTTYVYVPDSTVSKGTVALVVIGGLLGVVVAVVVFVACYIGKRCLKGPSKDSSDHAADESAAVSP